MTLLEDLPEGQTTNENLFCLSLPTLPRAWDSVMLGLAKECWRKFYYVIIEGWQSSGFAAHLAFGIAYHKALETYDKDLCAGLGREQSLINALRFCLSYGERDENGKFQQFDAQFTREPAKTRSTLTRSVAWYLEQFAEDPAQTYILANGAPAVELSFKINLDIETPDGDQFLLCGHLDRVVTINDQFYVMDRKTSKNQLGPRFWAQFSPNNQMSLYYTAGQVALNKAIAGILIDAVEIGAGYSRFQRHPVHRTPGQLVEWMRETEFYIAQAEQNAESGFWPMNDKSCGNYGGCPFQIICSRDPSVRQTFLKAEGYHKRQWNPLESR